MFPLLLRIFYFLLFLRVHTYYEAFRRARLFCMASQTCSMGRQAAVPRPFSIIACIPNVTSSNARGCRNK